MQRGQVAVPLEINPSSDQQGSQTISAKFYSILDAAYVRSNRILI